MKTLRHVSLFLILIGIGGCKKDPPPAPKPAEQKTPEKKPAAELTLCQRAHENMVRLTKDGPAPAVERMRRGEKQFLAKCAKQPETVVQCIAEAADALALATCSGLHPKAKNPKEELLDLCEAAFDHSITLVKGDGAPPSAIQQMEDRREAAIETCSREDPALVTCILDAKDAVSLRACRRHKLPPPSEAHEAACEAAYENMLKVVVPGEDMPQAAADSLKRQHDRFVDGCYGQTESVAGCMKAAATFEAFKACAAPAP